MEKKSIGSFLAVLRKASGLTQEEVAQRLYVSNKTVSKWERDESSPDLALIPVLAELFGVTCDEILRGERRSREQGEDAKSQVKTEMQVRRILSQTVNRFKNVSLIAVALMALGIICHFAVAYTYFKPLVAFAVALAFLLTSVVLEVVQLNRATGALKDGPLSDENALTPAVPFTLLHRIAFAVFALNAWACVFIWPMVSAEGVDYVNSVLSFEAYQAQLPGLMIFCLAATALAAFLAQPWLGLRMDMGAVMGPMRYQTLKLRRMARIQGIYLLAMAALILISPAIYVLTGGGSGIIGGIIVLATLVFGLVGIGVNLISTFRNSRDRLERLMILLLSARNGLYGLAAFSVLKYVGTSDTPSNPLPQFRFPSEWAFTTAFFQMVLITVGYFAIKYFLAKGQNNTAAG